MHKLYSIMLYALPIVIMIALIPGVHNDYLLTILYAAIIVSALKLRYEPNDLTVFVFGFLVMIVSEWFFISAGVETFVRHSLFGLMPLWLPFLWGYGFVAIKRTIKLLGL